MHEMAAVFFSYSDQIEEALHIFGFAPIGPAIEMEIYVLIRTYSDLPQILEQTVVCANQQNWIIQH